MSNLKSRARLKAPDRLYEIDCPVTAETQDQLNRKGKEGRLREIGIQGARCWFTGPMAVNQRVKLHVNFPHPEGKPAVVVFDAIVTEAQKQPPYEARLRFEGTARFLKDKIGNLLKDSPTV